jgi:glycosyltransferase involved in cell wall biosynthesis
MKILIDGRLYGLENAGLGRYLVNLVSELSEIDTKNEYTIFLRNKYFEELVLPKNWKKVRVDIRHYSIKEQLVLPKLINKEKPDLVHFPHFNVPVFYKGQYVVTIHDMLMHEFAGLSATTLPAPIYFFKQLAYRFVFRCAVKNARGILVPSQVIKNSIIKRYKITSKKILVVYEGVDRTIGFREGGKIIGPYFFYAGNVYPHKNLKRLLEAVKLLNKKVDQKVILVVACTRNVFTQRLLDTIKEVGINQFVRLAGFVPDSQLGWVYKNSLAFVFPSLSEGFGLPGLEAMTSGTLLLASDIPVFKEIYDNQAIYFDPLDPSSIVRAMMKVLFMTRREREFRIKESKKYVRKYDWSNTAKETLKVYEGRF